MEKSFYRRPLPDTCIDFASEDGKYLFRAALLSGYMENYFGLAAQFQTQEDPAYCGLASISVVLNSLGVDPNRLWKGPWRWYHSDMLDCCKPLEQVQKDGINLKELFCVSLCNNLTGVLQYASESDENIFRSEVKKVMKSNHLRLVVSYTRQVIGQTGTGHFSPIGGYHEEKDLVLIMDVARFKYSPHWIPLSLLFSAMQEIDKSSGASRGWLTLQRKKSECRSLTCLNLCGKSSQNKLTLATVDEMRSNFDKAMEYIKLNANCYSNILDMFSDLWKRLNMSDFQNLEDFRSMSIEPEHENRIKKIWDDVKKTEMFQYLEQFDKFGGLMDCNMTPEQREVKVFCLLSFNVKSEIENQKINNNFSNFLKLWDVQQVDGQELFEDINALRDIIYFDCSKGAKYCCLKNLECGK